MKIRIYTVKIDGCALNDDTDARAEKALNEVHSRRSNALRGN